MKEEKHLNYNKNNSSYSSKLFGIDWNKYYPHKIVGKPFTIRKTTYSEVQEFIKKNRDKLDLSKYGEGLFQSMEESRERDIYYKQFVDCFIIENDKDKVGIFMSNPSDWSTYYLRYSIFILEYRNLGLFTYVHKYLLEVLNNYNIHRVEADVSSSHIGNIHVYTKLKFILTSTILSDRWGATVRFTKYLSDKHELTFFNQFCDGVRPQLRADKTESKERRAQ